MAFAARLTHDVIKRPLGSVLLRHIYTDITMNACMHAYIHTYVYIYTYIYIYVYVYVYIHIYIYIYIYIAGWEEERSGPTGKSFRFVHACVRAVIVKWK